MAEIIPTGIPRLDEALIEGKGVVQGSSIVVEGTSGAGKELLAKQFAAAGIGTSASRLAGVESGVPFCGGAKDVIGSAIGSSPVANVVLVVIVVTKSVFSVLCLSPLSQPLGYLLTHKIKIC